MNMTIKQKLLWADIGVTEERIEQWDCIFDFSFHLIHHFSVLSIGVMIHWREGLPSLFPSLTTCLTAYYIHLAPCCVLSSPFFTSANHLLSTLLLLPDLLLSYPTISSPLLSFPFFPQSLLIPLYLIHFDLFLSLSLGPIIGVTGDADTSEFLAAGADLVSSYCMTSHPFHHSSSFFPPMPDFLPY